MYFVEFIISLMSSIFVFDAASISITSIFFPLFISMHEIHFSHGFRLIPFLQFIHFANILAILVFPIQ